MSKESLVSELVALVQEKAQAISEAAFAEGVASVPVGSGGGFSQADLDAAVAKALAEDAVEDQAQIDALHAEADAAIAGLKAQLDAVQAEASKVAEISAAYDRLKAALEAFKALLPGSAPEAPAEPAPEAPAEAPAPEQAPAG